MAPDFAPTLRSAASVISTPLPDVQAWLRAFDSREIPILAATANTIDDLRCNEDAVDAHLLAEGMQADPLMTLKLLRHVAALRLGRDQSDAETATEALVMLGITPFFREFGPQPTVEQALAGRPEALAGMRRVLRRAHRAARCAPAFAVHRHDHDAALIHEAALLHDFAELLLWAHAPALALAVARQLQAEPGLRSVDAQQLHLHIHLADLQQALMKAWHLPVLLVKISDDHSSTNSQVRNVQLALRVARHSARGWDNPALPDDVDAVADLLNLGTVPTLNLLHDLDR